MLTLASIACVSLAAPPGAPQPSDHARVRLIGELSSVEPGSTAWVALQFDIDEGWHLYFDGVNDSGFAPTAAWKAPAGVRVGEPLWTIPERHTLPGDLLDHIYEKSLTLMYPVEVPAGAAPGARLSIAAEVEWLVCSDVCLPGSASVALDLVVGDPTPGIEAARFARARENLPEPLPEDGTRPLRWRWEGPRLVLEAPAASGEGGGIAIFPRSQSRRPTNLVAEGQAEGATLRLRFEAVKPDRPDVRAIVEVKEPDGTRRWFDLKIEPGQDSK